MQKFKTAICDLSPDYRPASPRISPPMPAPEFVRCNCMHCFWRVFFYRTRQWSAPADGFPYLSEALAERYWRVCCYERRGRHRWAGHGCRHACRARMRTRARWGLTIASNTITSETQGACRIDSGIRQDTLAQARRFRAKRGRGTYGGATRLYDLLWLRVDTEFEGMATRLGGATRSARENGKRRLRLPRRRASVMLAAEQAKEKRDRQVARA